MTEEQYGLIEAQIKPFEAGGRPDSVAMLAWFLQTGWRMEAEDVDDAICDGGGDKGIDAIHVDDDLREITLFQSKHRRTAAKSQGDGDLKNLVGAAVYFETPEGIDELLQSKPNQELQKLLARLDIRARIAEGAHASRLVFVTNAHLDRAGRDYVKAVARRQPPLEVWDRDRLAALADRTRRPELRPDRVNLTARSPATALALADGVEMAVALVPARQLVRLPGIDDLTLFEPNVRLGLGRTRINQDLEKTVTTPEEHALFPAYHNGLTILTNELKVTGEKLVLEGVSVVNGCQSLLTLHSNEARLTDQLSLLVKVVRVPRDSQLPERITYRANNQNSVDIRDQRSRDAVQRDLQTQVEDAFKGKFAFQIRRGEPTSASEVLSNELAAQLIVAVYLGEPWNAVRKVRLFDDDYRRIFKRGVDAHKLYLMFVIDRAVDANRARLRVDLARSFASVRFTLAYLLGKVLEETSQGSRLLQSPDRFLPMKRAVIQAALQDIVAEIVDSVNFYVESAEEERAARDEIFDPKVVFKSKIGVAAVENDVIRSLRRLARRDPDLLFNVSS